LLNYVTNNQQRLKDKSPLFENVCLPGMTEDYKLSIYFRIEQESSLKLVFVCEETSPLLMREIEECAELMYREFDNNKIV
jgi:hypothetical protein